VGKIIMMHRYLIFTIILLISVKSLAGTIPFEVDAGGKSFTQYPVAVGVPFPEDEGCLDAISNLKLSKDTGGEEIPFQIHELCKWKNGKIKSALVQFLADVGKYRIDYGTGISKGNEGTQAKVTVMDESEYVEVDTGVLKFRINKNYGRLFDGIWLNGEKIIENGDMEAIGVDGQSYKSSNYQYAADEVKIEESGPIRACIRIRGKYVANDNAANDFRYIVRVYAYAGKGFLKMSHTIIDEDSTIKREVRIKGYNIQLKHLLPNSKCKLGKEPSGYHERQVTGGCYVSQGTSTYSGNIGSGTHASGWININNDSYGITAAVRYFWQNYPKGFVVNNEVLKICLHPDEGENFFGGSGIAKTHSMMLYFNSGGFDQSVIEQQVSLFNYNVFPKIPSEWYCNSGVFGKILPSVVGDPTPELLYYGYKAFGKLSSDCHRQTAQDPGNEDFLYYIQNSNNKNYFDKGEVKFWHSADMHIIHAEYGRSDVWGQISTQGGCRGYQTGCGKRADDDRLHGQVAGSGVYYLLTGDKWAEDVIKICGDCRCKNWMDLPDRMTNLLVKVLQERERGVELWRVMQAYNATGDKKYLEGMTESVKGLIGNYKRGFWMQHQSSLATEFLGKGHYWDNNGNYCKYAKDEQRCKIAVPWMSAYMFVPLVEYDILNKYYNFIEPSLVEDMLIGCMGHIVKYLTVEEGGKMGLRQDGCLDWESNYANCRIVYPLIYIRKLSGNQEWDRLASSLLDKNLNERNWYYSQADRMLQEYQAIGIKEVKIDTSRNQVASISWTEDSVNINKLIYGTKRFDGNVQDGVSVNVSGNSCELTNLMPGTKYYFQLITNSEKRTWMYTFKTKGGIDNVKITKIETTSATIEWITDFEGDSAVEYASENEWISNPGIYLHQSKFDEQTKDHKVVVEGLNKSTGYHFRTKSQGQGYHVIGEDDTFPTEGGVSGINAYPVDENSAVITFLTWPGPYYLFDAYNNPVMYVEVCYGKSSSNLSNSIKTWYGEWGLVLRRLDQDTKYYYKLNVDFRNFSFVTSPIYSFVTSRKQEEPIPQRLLCDFGKKNEEISDGIINFEDLMWFTIYWNGYQANPQDLRGDVAGQIETTSGQVPILITQPDKKVDFDDLMIFRQMWNWCHRNE